MASFLVHQQSSVNADAHEHHNPDIRPNDVVDIDIKIANSNKSRNANLQQQSQQQRAKEGKGKAALSAIANDSSRLLTLVLDPEPDFLQHRLSLFNKLKAEYNDEVRKKPRETIEIALPDDRIEIGTSWESTPASIARSISKSLSERVVISVVDGELWDLERPLEKSCKLELLDFDHPKGKQVFWHSSAHILGEAAEKRFGCHLCNGPPTENPAGFYYDMGEMNGTAIQESDWQPLETIAKQIVMDKQTFERLVVSKRNLLEMFKYSKYKVHFINTKVPDDSSTTVYRCGTLIDLCLGPHIPSTGLVKAFAILKNSSAYWLGNPTNESLQRICGVSFPEKKQLHEHKKYLAESANRDHRKIGKDQRLFFFDEVSPGSCFFLPHGARIYNAMLDLLKSEYRKRGYDEVMTPTIYKADLWKTSGHWDHYKDAMFTFEVENDKFGLKPMNCPGHCKIFAHRDVSYRDLPLRLADFGVLHRNELSGALTGLTRVRRFQQDDAHIFCTEEQVEDEIKGVFDFLGSVYGTFGFTFNLKLSTRPEKFLGDIATWDIAEKKLAAALDYFASETGATWELNPGDGAFYGPKIDVTMYDALRRSHQCGTIQLDFQLPQKFNLKYISKEDPSVLTSAAASPTATTTTFQPPLDSCRPVMIHRAIFGSFERIFAVLTEHYAGKWPFWLSPRQILIIPIMSAVHDYMLEVQKIFKDKGMYVDVDKTGNTLQKKIRNGQLEQYNFVFVVGAQEQETRSLNIRNRDDLSTQSKGRLIPLQEAIDKLVAMRDERRLINAF